MSELSKFLKFPQPNCGSRQVRTGFTLLETLLALSLLTILMVTVAASITLYAQYRHRGLEGAREAKVLLGTLEDLQNDLSACYNLRDATLEPPVDHNAANPDTSLGQEHFLAFSDAQSRPIRFVGRSNAILLLRQGLNPRFEWTECDPLASESQILWLGTGTTSIRLPSALEQRRTVEHEYRIPNEVTPAIAGLHRCWLPVTDKQIARDTPNTKNRLTQVWDKNREVQQIQFRYFDGTHWRRDWNSHAEENRLPAAVEIELVLVSAPQKPMRFVLRLPR